MRYILLAYYFFKENLYYWHSILARSIFLILLCVLITTLVGIGVNFDTNAQIAGIKYSHYMWYIWITELIVLSSLGKNFFYEIVSGEVINYLTRPINFLFMFWSKILGAKLVMIAILASFSFPIILLLNKGVFPSFNPLIFVAVFLIGISISVLIDTVAYILAFWLENTMFLRLIIQKFYFIFGGLFFPLDIYPEILRLIGESLPFRFALQLPAKYFTSGNIDILLENNGLIILAVWFVALVVINIVLHSTMIKRLEINGG